MMKTCQITWHDKHLPMCFIKAVWLNESHPMTIENSPIDDNAINAPCYQYSPVREHGDLHDNGRLKGSKFD